MCGTRWSRNRDADTRTVGHSGRTGPRSTSLISDSRSGTGTASSGFRNIRACRNSRPSGISAPAAGKRSSTARTGNASVGGLPDYKSRHHAQPTLNYRIGGFRLVETAGAFRSKLTKGTVIPVVWSRGLPSAPTSVRVYRKPNGKWFASFVVETKPEDDMPHTGNSVGIDWGGGRPRPPRPSTAKAGSGSPKTSTCRSETTNASTGSHRLKPNGAWPADTGKASAAPSSLADTGKRRANTTDLKDAAPRNARTLLASGQGKLRTRPSGSSSTPSNGRP